MGMQTLSEIRREIDEATERRAELWRVLGQRSDPELSAELKELEERLEWLWDEHRSLRARVRFGDRNEIIARARHEERLARAA
jgi:hypothetical protein